MSIPPKILAFAGSTRADSYNKKLARIAADGAREAGAEVTLIDLRDYPLPLFDEDLERDQGPPDPALALKRLFFEHSGLLISSPEYNSSISAVLKNAIDWVSRPLPGERAFAPFAGKVAALVSASPGSLGGLRGLVHLRSILGNLKIIVLPEQVAVPGADRAFDPAGQLIDQARGQQVRDVGKKLAEVLGRLG